MIFLWAALATYFYVCMRAFQQLNVVHYEWARILPTSVFMGIGDVALILFIVKADTIWLGVTNGLAGACGAFTAMWLNQWLHRRQETKRQENGEVF